MLCNEEMRKGILSRLRGYRYEHTLGCERAARKLAERFGGDPEKAGVAALLHDITKHLSPQEQLNLCEKYLSLIHISCPVCGAKVVKKKSARGYVYYSCDTYPTCQFMTWDKPLKTKCPQCDSSLFRHTDRDSKEVTDVCLREGCGYKELVKEGLSPEETEKNRQRREARAAKAAERAAAKACLLYTSRCV